MAHTRVVLFRRSTVETITNQCRNQNGLALLLCLYDFGHYSVRVPYVLVDVVLILRVSLTTKITVTLFTIISTYSPLAEEKSGGVTTDSPYNEARCSGASLYMYD